MDRPQGKPLARNLDALRDLHPRLVQRLLSTPYDPGLDILESGSGHPILVKRGVSLHSRHDPVREAASFLELSAVQHARRTGAVPVVFGWGMGYHLQALADAFPKIVVYEPDPSVILASLSRLDWVRVIPRLEVFSNEEELSSRSWDNTVLVAHRPSERLEPAAAARLRALMDGRTPRTMKNPGDAPWKIMVVTPVYGGSLPVAHHAARALTDLGHQVIRADMSRLAPYHLQVKRAGAAQKRRDEVDRRLIAFAGEYIAFLAETEGPDLVLALAQAPIDRTALLKIRSIGIPTAFWFVEDYRLMTYFRHIADGYDHFFHIQGQALDDELRRLGSPAHSYLPLAADPAVFKPLAGDPRLAGYEADLSFMGSGYPNRQAMFENLLDFNFKIWGTEWDPDTELWNRVQDGGRRIPTEETALIYNAGHINLNLHSSVFSRSLDKEGAFINPRTFEIAACGAFQLVDRRAPLELHFDLDSEVATFGDLRELIEKIEYFLARPDERAEYGTRARARVLKEHTYHHRMAEMLKLVAGI